MSDGVIEYNTELDEALDLEDDAPEAIDLHFDTSGFERWEAYHREIFLGEISRGRRTAWQVVTADGDLMRCRSLRAATCFCIFLAQEAYFAKTIMH
jgi:hypothetical protein